MAKKKCKVFVEVRGGTVVAAYADSKQITVTIVDHDDFTTGEMTMEKEMEYRDAMKEMKRYYSVF
jgi:hypothetical protein